jgi:hypothetical protein
MHAAEDFGLNFSIFEVLLLDIDFFFLISTWRENEGEL